MVAPTLGMSAALRKAQGMGDCVIQADRAICAEENAHEALEATWEELGGREGNLIEALV